MSVTDTTEKRFESDIESALLSPKKSVIHEYVAGKKEVLKA